MKFLILSRKGNAFQVTESDADASTYVQQLENDLNNLSSKGSVIQQVIQITEDIHPATGG